MVLVCFSFLLKQTFIPRGAMFVTAAVLALFTALTWGYAIEQSKTQISAWLANQSLMRDIAVLLSVDIIVQLTFCVFSACSRPHAELRRRMRIIRTVLTFFPGLMIFPVVFSMLVQVIFALPGTSFSLIATVWPAPFLLLFLRAHGCFAVCFPSTNCDSKRSSSRWFSLPFSA